MGLSSIALNNMVVSFSKDALVEMKKNVLKANGACWAVAAAQSMVNVENGVAKRDIGYSVAAGQALLATLCLWRGFKEE